MLKYSIILFLVSISFSGYSTSTIVECEISNYNGTVDVLLEENPFNDNSIQVGSKQLDANGKAFFEIELTKQSQVLIKVSNSVYRTIINPGDTVSLILNYLLLDKPDPFGRDAVLRVLGYATTNKIFQQLYDIEQDLREIKTKYRKSNGRLSKKYHAEAAAFFIKHLNNKAIQSELASSNFFAFELYIQIREAETLAEPLQKLFEEQLELSFSGIQAVDRLYGTTLKVKYLSKELNKITYVSFVQKELEAIESVKLNQALEASLLTSAIGMKWARQDPVKESLEKLVEKCNYSLLKDYCINFIEGQKSNLVGQELKDFELVNHKGEAIKFSDYRGRYLLIDFWATWCGPCIKSMKKLPELKSELGDRLEIVCVTTEIDEERIKRFIQKSGFEDSLDFVLASKKDDEIEAYFNKRAIPLYFLVSPDGIVLGKSLADPFPLINEHIN